VEEGGVMARLVTPLVVVLAVIRVSWLCRRLPLDELVDRIRRVPMLPPSLIRPDAYRALVNRWSRWLPPRGFRPCLKQSYLLLDLWSRCGLEPEFHLGVRYVDGKADGHAWLTVKGSETGFNSENGYEEAFVS